MVRIQKQLFPHNPDGGVWGDCHRTAYACLLGRPPEGVPHFAEGGDYDFRLREKVWLRSEGFYALNLIFPGEERLEDVLGTLDQLNPGVPFILGGTSSNGCGHSVVCQEGAIVCDPSLDNSGIVGPMSDGYWWITYLVTLPPVREVVQWPG